MDGSSFLRGWLVDIWSGLAIALFAGQGALIVLADEPEQPEIRVARLVRSLGDSDARRRQQAEEQLTTLGIEGRAELLRALSSSDIEVRLRAEQLLERLKLDELWAPSRVYYQADEQKLSHLLQVIAEQTGNHLHFGESYGGIVDETLTVNLNGLGYWQALDLLCDRSGNRQRPYFGSQEQGVVVNSGPTAKFPRAYGGPVRGQITSARRVFIEELNYEDGKGDLTHTFQFQLKFQWEDQFRIVGYAANAVLVDAVTESGQHVGPAQSAAGAWNAAPATLREVAMQLQLTPVPMSARRLTSLKIKWPLVAIGSPAVVEMRSPARDKQCTRDDVAVHVESLDEQAPGRFSLAITIIRDLPLPVPYEILFQEYSVEVDDQQGRAFRLQNENQSLTDRGVHVSLALDAAAADSQPAILRVHYPRLRARRDLELEFRDVPLPGNRPD